MTSCSVSQDVTVCDNAVLLLFNRLEQQLTDQSAAIEIQIVSARDSSPPYARLPSFEPRSYRLSDIALLSCSICSNTPSTAPCRPPF